MRERLGRAVQGEFVRCQLKPSQDFVIDRALVHFQRHREIADGFLKCAGHAVAHGWAALKCPLGQHIVVHVHHDEGLALAKLGCTYVVIGHSERRAIHKESDELINKKIKAALANELTPIFCVGEELSIREAGTHVDHVVTQVKAGLTGFHKPELKKIVIAYEPVWAIGTGKTATPEDAQEVCAAIRNIMSEIGSEEIAEKCRILYGGSVKSSNVVEIMKQPDVDGALVGGASLDPEEFAKIAKFYAAVNG